MVDWIRSIQGIVIIGATAVSGIGVAIRDHITIWNNKKAIHKFDRMGEQIRKQIGRHKDDIFKEIAKISNQTSKVEGALEMILSWMEKNGRS